MKEYLPLLITVAVVASVFLYLWSKGHLLRLSTYFQETKEELRKCSWPSWVELKGSTVVVMISILLLGVFTVAVDFILVRFITWMTKV